MGQGLILSDAMEAGWSLVEQNTDKKWTTRHRRTHEVTSACALSAAYLGVVPILKLRRDLSLRRIIPFFPQLRDRIPLDRLPFSLYGRSLNGKTVSLAWLVQRLNDIYKWPPEAIVEYLREMGY